MRHVLTILRAVILFYSSLALLVLAPFLVVWFLDTFLTEWLP